MRHHKAVEKRLVRSFSETENLQLSLEQLSLNGEPVEYDEEFRKCGKRLINERYLEVGVPCVSKSFGVPMEYQFNNVVVDDPQIGRTFNAICKKNSHTRAAAKAIFDVAGCTEANAIDMTRAKEHLETEDLICRAEPGRTYDEDAFVYQGNNANTNDTFVQDRLRKGISLDFTKDEIEKRKRLRLENKQKKDKQRPPKAGFHKKRVNNTDVYWMTEKLYDLCRKHIWTKVYTQ